MSEMRFYKFTLFFFSFIFFATSCKKPNKAVRYSEEEFKHKVDSMSAQRLIDLKASSEKNLEIRRRIELRYLRDSLEGKVDSNHFLFPIYPEDNDEIPLILHDTLD